MNTNIDWLIMKHGVTRRRINERRYNKDCKMISEENELMKDFGPWLATCKNINVRFYQEQVMIPE